MSNKTISPEEKETGEIIQKFLVEQCTQNLPTPKYWFGNVVGFNSATKEKPVKGVIAGLVYDETCNCGHHGWHYSIHLMDGGEDGQLMQPINEMLHGCQEPGIVLLTLKSAQ